MRAEELVAAIVRPLLLYLWKGLVLQKGSWKLEESKRHSCLQERQEGRSEESQPNQPHLKLLISNGANNPEKISKHMKDKMVIGSCQHKGKVVLDQPNNLL